MPEMLLVIGGIILTLAFVFGNGFNDAANAVSTIVATKVLPLRTAVMLSAFFNMIAAFFFTTAVARTIGKGLIDPGVITEVIILSGIISAIIWVYSSTFFGLPISVSHSLVGGLIGAALVAIGYEALIFSGIIKVLAFIVIAPILGIIAAFLFSSLVFKLVKKVSPFRINKYFQRLQLISVSIYSLGHGSNDAQNAIGIISILLFTGGFLGGTFDIPFWVIIICYLTIAAGTLAGGKRVIRTVGTKITTLRPIHGFCAETSGAGVIIASTLLGIPVSTTHVIAGSIMGVGITKRLSAVRWRIARNIAWAWILTVPITVVLGGIIFLLFRFFGF
ncbi:inorganic phosphate transporter [Candidatus Micrarchaeota archaeon]|nr:inorganic phosphate transporter [Candidatus Micrarchaeota archaeon]